MCATTDPQHTILFHCKSCGREERIAIDSSERSLTCSKCYGDLTSGMSQDLHRLMPRGTDGTLDIIDES